VVLLAAVPLLASAAKAGEVLFVSHRFSSVRTADRIYVLHHGHIVQHGNHDQLMAAGGLYSDLFTLQAAAYLHQDPADRVQPAGQPRWV
jgi:ABC-type transport system involved in cytochrome bd biosynthesis fused ATPase/permease subunit